MSNDATLLDDPLYTSKEVQQQLKIGRTLFYELIRKRELHAIRIGRCVRVSRSELERFLRHQGEAA